MPKISDKIHQQHHSWFWVHSRIHGSSYHSSSGKQIARFLPLTNMEMAIHYVRSIFISWFFNKNIETLLFCFLNMTQQRLLKKIGVKGQKGWKSGHPCIHLEVEWNSCYHTNYHSMMMHHDSPSKPSKVFWVRPAAAHLRVLQLNVQVCWQLVLPNWSQSWRFVMVW